MFYEKLINQKSFYLIGKQTKERVLIWNLISLINIGTFLTQILTIWFCSEQTLQRFSRLTKCNCSDALHLTKNMSKVDHCWLLCWCWIRLNWSGAKYRNLSKRQLLRLTLRIENVLQNDDSLLLQFISSTERV